VNSPAGAEVIVRFLDEPEPSGSSTMATPHVPTSWVLLVTDVTLGGLRVTA